MFTTARYFIKTAFGFFIIGLLTGLYIYGSRAFNWVVPYSLVNAHTHIILMGGVYMMILGVAVWFFPRPTKDDKKYRPIVVLWIYWIFTISTSARFVVEIMQGVSAQPGLQNVGFWLSVIQVMASVGLVISVWGRIRPVGRPLREKKGERF